MWCIFYSNGHDIWTYSDEDGPVEDAPAKFVQVVVQTDPDNKWYTQTGGDYYVWDDRGNGLRWYGVDKDGLLDYLDEPGWKKVLRGYTVSPQAYTECFKMAKEDPRFGKKATFYKWEKRP